MAQAYTSVMKFTVDGRPYMKDVHNLFGALVTQIKVDSHRYLFRTYDKTFSSEDAITVLGSLQFSQAIRVPDPQKSSRLVTTVTTTTFNMERGVAKALCQQFLWSRLMFNAVDPSSRSFRDRGLWQLTPKGLAILNDFCKQIQVTHPLLDEMKTIPHFGLETLERSEDDQLVLNRQTMASLFRIVINGLSVEGGKVESQATASSDSQSSLGSKRNSVSSAHSTDSSNSPDLSVSSASSSASSSSSNTNSNKTSMMDRLHLFDTKLLQSTQTQQSPTSSSTRRLRVIFSTQLCCDWLVSYCTIASRDEAEIVATEFLRHGWIDYQNENDHLDHSTIESSKGTLVVVTVKGRNLVLDTVKPIKSHHRQSSTASAQSANSLTSLPDTPCSPGPLALPPISTIPHASSRPPTVEASSSQFSNNQQHDGGRLMIILNDGQLRSLFTDFLRANFCSENLDFWIDYSNLRRKYKQQNPAMPSQNQMDLLEDAYGIWSTYLSPGAKWELNVDQDLQQEMARLVPSMVKMVSTSYSSTMINTSSQSNAQCLRSMIKRFDRVQVQICRLMSTDSVPKFVSWLQGYQKKENIAGLDHSIMMLKA